LLRIPACAANLQGFAFSFLIEQSWRQLILLPSGLLEVDLEPALHSFENASERIALQPDVLV
jgi:hypothetical protein